MKVYEKIDIVLSIMSVGLQIFIIYLGL